MCPILFCDLARTQNAWERERGKYEVTPMRSEKGKCEENPKEFPVAFSSPSFIPWGVGYKYTRRRRRENRVSKKTGKIFLKEAHDSKNVDRVARRAQMLLCFCFKLPFKCHLTVECGPPDLKWTAFCWQGFFFPPLQELSSFSISDPSFLPSLASWINVF